MSEYVTVPREPTDEMIRAGVAARWFVDNDEGKPANVRNSWEAMIAAAPPAASVRAKEVTNLEIATAFHEAYERLAPRYGYETRPESRKPFSDLPNELKLLMVAVVREVRTLLAPAVDERAASSEPEMCPNCVTPWKCNGPHEFPQAASSEAAVAWVHPYAMRKLKRRDEPFSAIASSEQRDSYTVPLYEHPAPTTADAGVTEAMVETFEAKFLECARTRPDSTLRDDIRAALVAALGARKGE